MRRGGGAGPLVLVLVLFSVLAALVYVNNQNPEIRRINSVAQQYADAWRNGNLDGIDYDVLSHSSVLEDAEDRRQVDPGKVAENVEAIIKDLDGGKGEIRPEKIEVDRTQTQRSGKENDLASTRLWVTWKLLPAGLDQQSHLWTYAVTLQERLLDGRWRVVWTPETVHPAIRQGLVFRVNRSQPPRAGLLGAGDTQLWPVQQGQPQLAPAVIGRIVNRATYEESRLADLRAEPGDTLGVAGLQDLYDERLAGGARIEITAAVAQGFSPGIAPTQQPLFVGAPDTPKPLKVTLDRRTQLAAEAALPTATPATVVVVKASTGELLAAANTGPAGTSTDYALSAQQPPGPVFGLASTLALLRSPASSQQTQESYQLTTRIDCSEPFTVGGQVFRNPQGPRLAGVQLGAAVEGGCTTGLARAAADVRPETLQTAAYDLGLATPLQPTAGAPGLLTVADQLGIPAFHGTVPPTAEDPARDAVNHAQNMTGEGQVLMSPLSMARGAATVASGTRRSVRLIVDPAPHNADAPKDLPAHEVEALRVLLAKGVSEPGGTAHALAPIGDVHALAGTAGYGTGAPQTRQAWCVGYLGDYAFAVLVPNGVATPATTAAPPAGFTNPALTIASKFLAGIR